MPVSHLSLTVSHLPTSCSFYLAALQPLGYKYIGQNNNHIGFGIDEPDFFICQESLGVKPSSAHIAFNAPSRAAVDAFFTAALKAGGTVHDGPALRDFVTGYYSAAVVDFDGNAVEVVHRDNKNQMSLASVPKESGAIEPTAGNSRSGANDSANRSPLRSIVNNIVTNTTSTLDSAKETSKNIDNSGALVGTLLGAAAGAAFAYAMVKSEHPHPPKEFQIKRSETVYQTVEAPPTPRSVACVESARSRRRSASYSDTSSPRIRMIEAPPTPVSEVSSPSTLRAKSTRAIKAPPPAPTPPTVHSSSKAISEAIPRTMPPPSAETYYTVEVEPSPSHYSRSSRTPTSRSHRSRRSSMDSSRRSKPPIAIAVPSDVRSALHKTPADFPLPKTAFSMPISPASASPHSSRHSRASQRTTRTADIPLPPSARTSYAGSTARSSYVREPRDYPLPPSARTSFLSRAPPGPRSVASRSSQSTVKPLTRANLAGSVAGAGRAGTDIDDLDSVAPSDSISQVSDKERRRRRRVRKERDGEGERPARRAASTFGLGRR